MVSIARGAPVLSSVFMVATLAGAGELVPDAPIRCDACDGWNKPNEPFRVFGNTFYVGTAELASIAESFRNSIDTVSRLPCDILLAPHPGFAQLEQKFERSKSGESDAFVDPAACRSYAASASLRLEQRLREEQR